jgi:hypothetical protein
VLANDIVFPGRHVEAGTNKAADAKRPDLGMTINPGGRDQARQ